MWISSIPFFITLILALLYWQSPAHRRFNISTFIFCYVLSAFALSIYFYDDWRFVWNVEAMFYLGGIMLFWLLPFTTMHEPVNQEFRHVDDMFLKHTVLAVGLLTTIGTLIFLPEFRNIFGSDIAQSRNDIALGLVGQSTNILQRFAIQCSSLVPIDIFLLLYCYTFRKCGTWGLTLLLIGSFCEIGHVLIFLGRDGFLQTGLLYLFAYLYFRPHMQAHQKRLMLRLMLLTLALVVTGGLVITFARFDRNLTSGIYNPFEYGVMFYFGQIGGFFNAFYTTLDEFRSSIPGWQSCSLLRSALSNSNYAYLEEQQELSLLQHFWHVFGHGPNVFGTFLVSLIQDFGKIGTALISLAVGLAITWGFALNRVHSFSAGFASCFYAYFISINLFYSRFSLAPQGNVMVLICIGFILLSAMHQPKGTGAADVAPEKEKKA